MNKQKDLEQKLIQAISTGQAIEQQALKTYCLTLGLFAEEARALLSNNPCGDAQKLITELIKNYVIRLLAAELGPFPDLLGYLIFCGLDQKAAADVFIEICNGGEPLTEVWKWE